MATKLQELLDELKGLKEFSPFTSEINTTLISKIELEQLIAKYAETTPTYKPGDKEISYTEEEVKFLLIKFSMDFCDVHPKNVVNWLNREKK